MNVNIIGDQLHIGTVFQRGNNGAGGAVGDAGHGVIQVGHVAGTGGKRSLGGIIIRAGVGNRDAHLIVAVTDKIQIAGFFRGNVHQLDQPAAACLQPAEHGGIGPLHILGVLCADLFGADVGAFHVDADQIRAALVLVGRGHVHDAVQDLLAERHGCGADGQHALARLKISDGLQAGLVGVAEIVTDCAVEMDVHQTRQRIGTARVNDILALLRGRAKDDAAIADDEVLFHKAAAVAVDFCIFDNHCSVPPQIRSRSGLPRRRPE